MSLIACLLLGIATTGSYGTKLGQQTEVAWNPELDGIEDSAKDARQLKNNMVVLGARPDGRVPIEGKFRTIDQFAAYVKHEVATVIRKAGNWCPSLIVLHNTAIPSLHALPNGYHQSDMPGLAKFYGTKLKWEYGPSAFVDQNGVWEFTKLTHRGTHSPTYNMFSWGIEQLGNYERDPYSSGAGLKVHQNAVDVCALLLIAGNIPLWKVNDSTRLVEKLEAKLTQGFLFHRQDPNTDHYDCPGKNCSKKAVVPEILTAVKKWKARWNSI